MPVIQPTSSADCIEFINENRQDVEEGVYDIRIKGEWLAQLPQEVFQLLLTHCPSSKRVIAASVDNPEAGAKTLTLLAKDDSAEVRLAVAQNIHTPPSDLRDLSFDISDDVRLAIARNPAIPDTLLEQLSQDKEFEIRLEASKNPGIKISTLNRLASDRADTVRTSIQNMARNHRTPPDMLEKLSKVRDAALRQEVALNSATPRKLLAILARDQVATVRSAAHSAWIRIANNQHTDPRELTQLAGVRSEEIRSAVAGNTATPEEILAKLAVDHAPKVRQVVASNPKTPLTCLKKMIQDPLTDVRRAVAKSPNLPEPILEALCQDKAATVRATLAANPIEIKRRETNNLCMLCGNGLKKIESMFGGKCMSCRKNKPY
ncbi:MAG: hypothetical protein HQL52_16085 [Magnetococcales bacterium]|nr:hypothetical protein [Magnetococcales bacterium]